MVMVKGSRGQREMEAVIVCWQGVYRRTHGKEPLLVSGIYYKDPSSRKSIKIKQNKTKQITVTGTGAPGTRKYRHKMKEPDTMIKQKHLI